MENPFSLQNKTILITGASSGIGQQCAIDCSRQGARIIMVGRNKNRLEETESFLEGSGHSKCIVDITSYDEIDSLLRNHIDKSCPIDGFIHSAGIEKTLPFRNLKPKDYMEIYSTNFISGVNILKILTKKNTYSEDFKAVFISSITALVARVGTLAYTASKGALVSGIRELAIELAPKGINVNCISPGTVLTPMMKNLFESFDDETRKKRLEGFSLGIGRPEDISYACIFLLSNAARWITGQNLVIDGGYTIK